MKKKRKILSRTPKNFLGAFGANYTMKRGMTMGVFVASMPKWAEFRPLLGSNDDAEREAFLADIRTSVEVAKRLNAKHATVVTGFMDRKVPQDIQTDRIIDCMRRAGDIVAIAGLKETTTGDTLCDPAKPIILERMEFPDPVIELSVEPKTKADQEKMGVALNRLAAEDPSFRVSTDHESGQTIIKGMGELHLDILVDRMKREFKVEANVGAPQVAYREYLGKPVDVDYTHKKQSGGSGQFGRVKVKVTPGERGQGFVFEDEIKGGNIPKEYIPAIEKGFREQAESGHLVGFPIIDFTVTLYDGAYHDVDSSAIAFEIAGRGAMREVADRSGIKLLEPIMKVEVVTPEDYLGDVIGDLNSRRGQIQGTDTRGNAQAVEANVPLANMFGYVNELRSFTQGRAQYSMQFSHYDEVPANVAQEVKEKLA